MSYSRTLSNAGIKLLRLKASENDLRMDVQNTDGNMYFDLPNLQSLLVCITILSWACCKYLGTLQLLREILSTKDKTIHNTSRKEGTIMVVVEVISEQCSRETSFQDHS